MFQSLNCLPAHFRIRAQFKPEPVANSCLPVFAQGPRYVGSCYWQSRPLGPPPGRRHLVVTWCSLMCAIRRKRNVTVPPSSICKVLTPQIVSIAGKIAQVWKDQILFSNSVTWGHSGKQTELKEMLSDLKKATESSCQSSKTWEEHLEPSYNAFSKPQLSWVGRVMNCESHLCSSSNELEIRQQLLNSSEVSWEHTLARISQVKDDFNDDVSRPMEPG